MIAEPVARDAGRFNSPRGVSLHYRTWIPPAPVATLVIVHGYSEHTGRYEMAGKTLAEQGFGVYALDLQGHGKSEGTRAHIDRFDNFVEEARSFIGEVALKREGAARPVFLMGHSMGGLIATLYAMDLAKSDRTLRGLILIAPAFKIDHLASPMLIAMAGFLSAVAPKLGVVPSEPRGISRDPAVVQSVKDDPLFYHGKTRARLGYEFLKASRQATERAGHLKTPVLLIHGEEDRIIPLASARSVFEDFPGPDKTFIAVPAAFHALFHEPEGPEILQTIAQWMRERI